MEGGNDLGKWRCVIFILLQSDAPGFFLFPLDAHNFFQHLIRYVDPHHCNLLVNPMFTKLHHNDQITIFWIINYY